MCSVAAFSGVNAALLTCYRLEGPRRPTSTGSAVHGDLFHRLLNSSTADTCVCRCESTRSNPKQSSPVCGRSSCDRGVHVKNYCRESHSQGTEMENISFGKQIDICTIQFYHGLRCVEYAMGHVLFRVYF